MTDLNSEAPSALDMWGDPSELPAERELRLLKDYLMYPRWNMKVARYVLIGIAPEESLSLADGVVTWLPGVSEEWRKNRRPGGHLKNLRNHIELELDEVAGFINGDSRPPKMWIERARQSDFKPPWWDIALEDDEVRGILNLPDARKFPAQSDGGFAVRNVTPQFSIKCEIVLLWYAQCEHADFNPKEFKKKMIQTYCGPKSEKVQPRTVSDWINHLNRVRQGKAVSEKWLVEIRSKMR